VTCHPYSVEVTPYLSPVGTCRCAKYCRNPNGFYVGEFSVVSRHWYNLVPVEAITDESPGSFVGWCEQHNHRCFIGEFGVPRQDARYMTTLNGALAYMRENSISGTYWASGSWWGDDNLSNRASGPLQPRGQAADGCARTPLSGGIRQTLTATTRSSLARVSLTKPIPEVSIRLDVSTTLFYSLHCSTTLESADESRMK